VGVRPGNLERVLQELTTITVVSGPVRGHQSGALARQQLVLFSGLDNGLLVLFVERAERTRQRGTKLTTGQLLGSNRSKL